MFLTLLTILARVKWGAAEFGIVMLVVAAAIVVLIAGRRGSSAIKQHLIAGSLTYGAPDDVPRIEVNCHDGNFVVVTRSGFADLEPRAVSAAIEIKGFDITLKERITQGGAEPVDSANFLLDFLVDGERYHLHYISEITGRSAALSFHNVAGFNSLRQLS